MNLLTVFKSNQGLRPAPKLYFRPVNIEAMRFPQSLLVKSIR